MEVGVFFYSSFINPFFVISFALVGGALILVLLVTASTLAVHAAESLVDRRRVLAALVAAGISQQSLTYGNVSYVLVSWFSWRFRACPCRPAIAPPGHPRPWTVHGRSSSKAGWVWPYRPGRWFGRCRSPDSSASSRGPRWTW